MRVTNDKAEIDIISDAKHHLELPVVDSLGSTTSQKNVGSEDSV
ncbi:predicted protein [Sclerotinia sclerotiorum 1980 UF-70]|uniref:Uncharacterized protein n=1 Tax=Sclerotinia sclerotiorum (strain ATCC 18683 / 1980 / Ss-1) TaxID=665079 RepID=A7EQV4_SCLS1|nr:predicted protein [Sclerotinia sclerotiorum 1980 UF-70]EDN91846.1 predicted protein [Sclerotinia sclerotiorum 1980 UF-70]